VLSSNTSGRSADLSMKKGGTDPMRQRLTVRSAALSSAALLAAAVLSPLVLATNRAAAATTPACTTSAPVAALPLGTSSFLKPTVSLTATNGLGTWAGVRFDGEWTFQVVSWRAGRATVLDTLSYQHAVYDDLRSVRVVGVSAAGAVIVSAQATNSVLSADLRVGLRYQNGRRYVLQSSPIWKSVDPNGVTPDGRVVGLARTKTASQVVEWSAAGVGAVRVVVTDAAHNPVIDGHGNIAYSYLYGGAQFGKAVLADGRRLQLGAQALSSPDNGYISSAAGNYVYGRGLNGSLRWDLTEVGGVPSGSTVFPRHLPQLAWVDASSPAGGLVGGNPPSGSGGRRLYLDPYGNPHLMPYEFDYPQQGQKRRSVAVADDGTVSFTDPTGHVRFFHCRLNPVSHDPRGGLDSAVDIAGSVQLRGAAADPDGLLAPVSIEVFDTTGGKHTLVARTTTGLPSPGLDAALHITGDHGFSAVFHTGLGNHSFCVDAVNVGAGTVASISLGCRTVVEHRGPFGLPG
jgi:hypothetical protein